MKRFFFLLLLVVINDSLQAAVKEPGNHLLNGKVFNTKTKTPLVGATVYIPDLKMGAITDEEGYYEIKGLPRGTYLVEVRYAGFGTATENIFINESSMEKNWKLSPAIVEGDEVVITGVSKATEVRKQPTHISVLNHLQLQHTATDNIIGKIAKLPGVSAITTGPDVMKPVIRGLSYNRVVVVNNGIRQEGQQWGDEHGIEVDAYSAGKMEVLRGASSLMYGSDALGGVVQILPPGPAPEGHIQAKLITNYQTNNGLTAFHGALGGNKEGFTWRIYGTGKLAHDYKNKYDDYVFNSKFREGNFGASIGLNKDWGYSHLSFSSYNLQLGLPEGDRDSTTGKFLKEVKQVNNTVKKVIATNEDFMSYQPLVSSQKVMHRKLTWDNKIFIGSGNIAFTFAYQENHRREYEDVLSPDTPGLYMKLNTVNYNIRYSMPEGNGWQTTFGSNGMIQTNKNAGDEMLIPDFNVVDLGVFGITQKTINRFTISGGLRYDTRIIHSKPLKEGSIKRFSKFNKNFSSISGSAGFSYEAGSHWILKANISRGFRAPAIPELASNGVHDGTIRYEIGNQNLKPENSTEFDAGVAFRTSHVSASLYGYYNNIQHFIYTEKLQSAIGGDSIRTTKDGDFAAYQYNQTNAHLYGMEASIDIHPHPLDWLHFKNTFSFVRGISDQKSDSMHSLPMIPPARWLTELGFNFPLVSNTFKNVYLTFELNNTFAQNYFFSAYHTETATPAHTLLNIEAGTDVTNRKKKTIFSFYMSAENLTNVAYQDHLSRLKYLAVNEATGRQGIFNMGRNFSFKVVVPLDFKW